MDSAQNPPASKTGKSAPNKQFTPLPIFGKFSLILLVVIFITLLPHYFKIYSPSDNVPVAFVVHGFLYLAWFLLFAVQSNLVVLKKTDVHKKLGYEKLW